MNAAVIDLRSDTVTQPTEGMLQAMMQAPVGDDVYGEDPSVNALEAEAAELFGKEAALFCPSGTMTNQIAIRVLTQPQDEVICDRLSHIYNYEGGGMAANALVSARLVHTPEGKLRPEDVLENINPEDVHFPRTSLVALENTVNKGGGCYYTLAEIQAIREVCQTHNLSLHLDGARLFNALVETGDTPETVGACFDTISLCLSKGLGAPVGSLLLGTHEAIKQGRRVRKVFGGGMRQAGFLAAAGSYALQHHVDRLKEDHERARKLGEALQHLSLVEEVLPVFTNLVIFKLKNDYLASDVVAELKQHHILTNAMGPRYVRLVTHLQVDDAMVEQTIAVLQQLYG